MKKKRIFKTIVVICLTIAFYAAIGNPIVLVNNERLKRSVTAVNTQNVELNNVVPFEWDAVYTFEPYASKEEIEEIVGFKSNAIKETVSEGMVQLLFVEDQKVVSSVCGYQSGLGYSIDFFGKILYTDNAVFSVEKDSGIVRLSYTK